MPVEERDAKILNVAVYVFGTKDRVLKTIEELGELSAALARFVNQPVGHQPEEIADSVLEELADGSIMLDMCRLMFDGQVDSRGRTLERIREEKLARLARLADWDLKE